MAPWVLRLLPSRLTGHVCEPISTAKLPDPEFVSQPPLTICKGCRLVLEPHRGGFLYRLLRVGELTALSCYRCHGVCSGHPAEREEVVVTRL
jgi:hypothetical protein